MGFVAVGLAFDHRRSFPAGRQRVSGGQRSPGFDKPARQPNSPRRRFDNDAAAAATVADCYQLGMPRVVEQCFHRIIPRDQAAHVDVGVAQLPAGQRVSPHAFDLEVHAIAPSRGRPMGGRDLRDICGDAWLTAFGLWRRPSAGHRRIRSGSGHTRSPPLLQSTHSPPSSFGISVTSELVSRVSRSSMTRSTVVAGTGTAACVALSANLVCNASALMGRFGCP
jgi:hypothetical protein